MPIIGEEGGEFGGLTLAVVGEEDEDDEELGEQLLLVVGEDEDEEEAHDDDEHDDEQEEEDDDEVDLFGSDDEEDAEAERIKAERVAAYNAKKAAKPKTIAKVGFYLFLFIYAGV